MIDVTTACICSKVGFADKEDADAAARDDSASSAGGAPRELALLLFADCGASFSWAFLAAEAVFRSAAPFALVLLASSLARLSLDCSTET